MAVLMTQIFSQLQMTPHFTMDRMVGILGDSSAREKEIIHQEIKQ